MPETDFEEKMIKIRRTAKTYKGGPSLPLRGVGRGRRSPGARRRGSG